MEAVNRSAGGSGSETPSAAYSDKEYALMEALREALASVQYEDEIVYFELNDQRGCETGSWWWHCTEFAKGPEFDA